MHTDSNNNNNNCFIFNAKKIKRIRLQRLTITTYGLDFSNLKDKTKSAAF